MKLSSALAVPMTTAASAAMAVEDAPLLQKDITTDSKKTTKKKEYSSGVCRSMAFGTFAFLLLGVVLLADRGGKINNNIIDNTIRSPGKKKLHTTGKWIDIGDKKAAERQPKNCPKNPDIKRGMCETTGSYKDVLPYLDHQKVIPGKIYYGLDFNDLSYEGTTYTPHLEYPDIDWKQKTCWWGHGETVGLCMVGSANSSDNVCPSPRRQIVHAWQRCAELCNDEPHCSTFSVSTDQSNLHNERLDYYCFFHRTYKCRKENNKSVGIDNYVKREDIRDAKYDNTGVWSGICRTLSGRTNDYACSNTPIPKKDFSPIPKEELKCFGHTNYDGCLNGFYGPNEVRQFSGPDGIWVFDVGNIMGRPCPACDNVPDCDHFCDECAGGPVKAGACSADNQYFCLPGP